jgi:hypothetical protein
MPQPPVIVPDLRRLFLAIAHTTVASGGLAACTSGDAGESDGWERVPCPTFTALPEGAGLQTPSHLSYVGIYEQFAIPGGGYLPDGGLTRLNVAEIARSGDACSGASSTMCDELANKACAQLPCRIAIVSEEGAASRLGTREELLNRLGDIDSAAEVVLLAAFDGHAVCPGIRDDRRAIGAEVRTKGDGFELRTTWDECGQPLQRALLSVDAAGKLVVVSKEQLRPANCVIGRRPPGLCPERDGPARSETGVYLARAARLEHASVYAFYQLIQELRVHQAPEALRLMALDAMLDEVRHARDVQALARDFGAETVWAQVKQTALRSLLEIAIDNAREGCVRETFGALLATYQAASAEHGGVRRVMAQIAEDETRHAMLSWKLKAWLSTLLCERERAQVAEAELAARGELADELEFEQPESLRRALGLPSRDVAALLFKRLSRALPN